MNTELYDFCCYYVMLGDVTESAVKAGFDRKNALKEGIKLLESAKCRKIISRIRNAVSGSNKREFDEKI